MKRQRNFEPLADYHPHAEQIRFHKDGGRFATLAAGARGGKTHAAAREMVIRMFKDRSRIPPHKPLHYWCAAPTYAIGNVQRRELLTALGGVASPLVKHYIPSRNELWLKGNILIEFKTTDRPGILVAVGLDGLWLDEAARAKPEAWYGGLRQRLTDRAGWALFSTTPLGRNWFYEAIVSRALKGMAGYSLHSWPTIANTHLSVEAMADVLKARDDMPIQYYMREYEASFDAFIGQIYSEFCEKTHLTDSTPTTGGEMRFGVDWGHTHKGAIIAVRKIGDRYHVVDEFVKAGVLVDGDARETWVKIAKTMIEKHGKGIFYCDSANAENIAAFRHNHIPARNASKAVLPGIEFVSRLLHPGPNGPHLVLNKKCTNLVDEFQRYRWADDVKTEKPVKENDDAIDALRYALYVPAFKVKAA